jgi:hypothetical protein
MKKNSYETHIYIKITTKEIFKKNILKDCNTSKNDTPYLKLKF